MMDHFWDLAGTCTQCGITKMEMVNAQTWDAVWCPGKKQEAKPLPNSTRELSKTPRCECGADKVYGPGNVHHSGTMPCPLYRKA